MGFWSTLGSIRENRANFKQWEKDEADNDAKRKELYQRSPLSEQELAQKQKLADTIIDTITIMDQHSEEVSEDVETVTQPLVAVAPTIGFYASVILGGLLMKKPMDAFFDKKTELFKQITDEE